MSSHPCLRHVYADEDTPALAHCCLIIEYTYDGSGRLEAVAKKRAGAGMGGGAAPGKRSIQSPARVGRHRGTADFTQIGEKSGKRNTCDFAAFNACPLILATKIPSDLSSVNAPSNPVDRLLLFKFNLLTHDLTCPCLAS